MDAWGEGNAREGKDWPVVSNFAWDSYDFMTFASTVHQLALGLF